MKQPLFSIVIPTYNRSDLVQGAVRSVLRQTFKDFEVVVSDNCSTDDTQAVVEAFGDPRVRYVRTPKHGVIGESWEFARSQAHGTLIMMLSDDDALMYDTLERFAEQHLKHKADFLFCNLAEYRDESFAGSQKNTVTCRAFSDESRVVSKDEFIGPLYAFKPKFNMHPSAFMFARSIAEKTAERCGRFFQTNGVEYFAWPLVAIQSTAIVYIDAPLVILGRTAKSWGTRIVLSNPGKESIQSMIADVAHDRGWIPLTNFTLCNLMAEGMMLAKLKFADELSAYPFDEQRYLRSSLRELRRREAMGVDVSAEIKELLDYAEKYPELKATLTSSSGIDLNEHDSALRKLAASVGLGGVHKKFDLIREARRIRQGDVKSGFLAAGSDFGFRDAVECADFLSSVTSRAVSSVQG